MSGKKERNGDLMQQLPQPELDLEGRDPETRLQFRWAENGRRCREFWTPERRCLSWMQGTTPDESDMRWWAAQPSYRRSDWLELHRRAQAEAAANRAPIAACHVFLARVEEESAIMVRQDESLTNRFLGWIREDFLSGRPCSIDLKNCSPGQRHRSERCLHEALCRAGIPAKSLGMESEEAMETVAEEVRA